MEGCAGFDVKHHVKLNSVGSAFPHSPPHHRTAHIPMTLTTVVPCPSLPPILYPCSRGIGTYCTPSTIQRRHTSLAHHGPMQVTESWPAKAGAHPHQTARSSNGRGSRPDSAVALAPPQLHPPPPPHSPALPSRGHPWGKCRRPPRTSGLPGRSNPANVSKAMSHHDSLSCLQRWLIISTT